MGVRPQWDSECSRQSKVCQFKVSLAIDEQVLGLQVPMQDTVAVAVTDALNKLCHEFLDHRFSQSNPVYIQAGAVWECLAPSTFAHRKSFHVFLEVEVEEFEDEVELVAVRVNNVQQPYDVGIIHLLEQGDLADRCAGHSLIFGLESYLLQGDDSVGVGEFAGFVHHTIRPYVEQKSVSITQFPAMGILEGVTWIRLINGERLVYVPSPIFSIFW